MEYHITKLTLMKQLIFYKIDPTINAKTKKDQWLYTVMSNSKSNLQLLPLKVKEKIHNSFFLTHLTYELTIIYKDWDFLRLLLAVCFDILQ